MLSARRRNIRNSHAKPRLSLSPRSTPTLQAPSLRACVSCKMGTHKSRVLASKNAVGLRIDQPTRDAAEVMSTGIFVYPELYANQAHSVHFVAHRLSFRQSRPATRNGVLHLFLSFLTRNLSYAIPIPISSTNQISNLLQA